MADQTIPEKEQEEFLKDLTPKEGEDIIKPEGEQPEGEIKPEPEDKPNRQIRRLQSKYQAERESSIALAARLEALTEAQKARAETEEGAYLKAVEKIYGNQSPEAVEATALLKNAIKGAEERATERAVEMMRQEREEEQKSIREEEKSLDTMVEEIEDEFGVDMDAQTKKGFFTLLEKFSPKDSDGNITEYADPVAVWEEYQNRKQTRPNRAKDIASRSMNRQGASAPSNVEQDANERWLRENGII